MSKNLTESGKIVRNYLKMFPRLPKLALAKKIYNEHPLQFNTIESARTAIRYHTNASGKKNAAKSPELKIDHKPVYEMPQSFADPFEDYVIKQSRNLILSDLHFPYQNNEAIILALDYGKKMEANSIIINGDLIDFATISRFENNWHHRRINEEFDAVRMFLRTLRKHFPNAKITYKLGNHCERWEKWLFTKAPEVFDVPDFQLEIILRLGELGIEIVKDKRPIRLGKLTLLHGHELPGMGGVNPARATFTKTLENVLVGHYHRSSKHSEPTMHGNMIVTKSQGCLCELHPAFMPVNKWNLGFSFCELDIKTGNYELDILDIIKGKIYR